MTLEVILYLDEADDIVKVAADEGNRRNANSYIFGDVANKREMIFLLRHLADRLEKEEDR